MRYLWLLLLFFSPVNVFSAVKPLKHEIRAVWLATIYGLDWPQATASVSGEIQKQQLSFCRILDSLKNANFNTVFLQVRLRGDVIYRSAIEPAAKVFSGKYGTLPGYDPLSFAIRECHRRGMECHAWFVTFPVGSDRIVREQGKKSVVKRHPQLCRRFRGEWYLDPGMPGTSDYILSLVKELVLNYDIDGIQFDYIRYPDNSAAFPDKQTYQKYGKKRNKDEWRRENITRIVTRVYDWIKANKPWVQVSSSPIGKFSSLEGGRKEGWTAYESVFQDVRQWLLSGKQDMILPMMYYLYDAYFPFLDQWVSISNGRLVVPGLGAYRMRGEEGDWAQTDLTDQMDYSRYFGGKGTAFFRCSNILDNTKGIYAELKNNYYRYPALLPPLSWLDDTVPQPPVNFRVEYRDGGLRLSWEKPESEIQDLTYTVYYSYTDAINKADPARILETGIHETELFFPVEQETERGYLFFVTASSRFHIESNPSSEAYFYVSPYVK